MIDLELRSRNITAKEAMLEEQRREDCRTANACPWCIHTYFNDDGTLHTCGDCYLFKRERERMDPLLRQFDSFVARAEASSWDGRSCDDNYSIGYSYGGGTPHTPMTCADCGRQHSWTPRFFPRMMMATCWACTMKTYEPPKLPWWKAAP